MLTIKIGYILFITLLRNQFCLCDDFDDFQSNVDAFADAFDDAYTTELYPSSTDESNLGNEIATAVSAFEEGTANQNEEELQPAVEEPVVTETIFPLGGEIKHELNEEVRALAEKVVSSISPLLRLVNVTEAITMVTNKVQRSLMLNVASRECEGEACPYSCRVELINRSEEDEVVWQNCIDTPSINMVRRKRGAIGGFKQVDDDEARELAEIAAQTLDSIDADDTKRVVLQVLRAQKQLVNGIMYHLTLEMAMSDCKEEAEKCEGKLSDHNICKILMQRLFSGEAPHNAQVIKSECTPISKAKEADNKKGQKRARRHVTGSGEDANTISDNDHHQHPHKKSHTRSRTVGGKTKEDPESDRIKEISAFALEEIAKASNSNNKQKIVRVVDARSQVVAGIKYFLRMELVETNCRKDSDQTDCSALDDQVLQTCDVVVWDKPWKKFRAVTKIHCSPDSQIRSKRGIPGGLSPANPNDPDVQDAARFAVSAVDQRSNSLFSSKLVVVKEAKTQVVAGTNYYLKLQLVETNCRKNAPTNSACRPTPDKVVQECDVVVYDRPWDKHRELTSVQCSPVLDNSVRQQRRVMVGGLTPANPNDANVKEAANFAVSEVDRRSNSLFSSKLLVVKEAKTQVVAGVNYHLKLQLVESNCRKGSAVNSACSPAAGKVVQECDVVVYDRPWDKHRELISVRCSPVADNKVRNQRDVLVGGQSPADPNDAGVKKAAKFAVSEIDRRSNSLFSSKLVVVKEAKTQVVAGTNYYLKLQLVETNCRKGTKVNSACNAAPDKVIQECDVVVYDRPWDKHRELTSVTCSPISDNSVHRQQRAVLVGGHSAQDKDSAEVQEMAHLAVEDINTKSNSEHKLALVEVLSAHTQVVSGVNYHLVLKIAETNCKKNSDAAPADCTPKEEGGYQQCDVTIWSQPWLNKRQVTKSNCKPVAQAKKSTGEPESVDVSNPEVISAAKFSLKAIDRGSNSMYKHALLRILDAKVQTVSGKKYFLTLEIGESECTKQHHKEDCSIREGNSLSDRCNVVVWDRPWLNKKEVVDVRCGLRTKRSIVSKPNNLNQIHRDMFEEFKTKYNKVYPDDKEHNRRFRIFRANLKKIQAFQENEQGTAVYGPNMFADLTANEFKQKYLGLKPGPVPKPSSHHMVAAKIPDITLPTDFDWREHNAVTPVKNQGQCGSCWAFSVTGNVEGQWAIKHGKLLSLSEQELVDCDKMDSGCNGGYMTQAYEAIENIGGLETEDEYPYDAHDETCKFNETEVAVTVTSSVNITTNETQIAQWLFANGPISIGINANAMQFYMGGVSHPFKFLCNKDQLDHGVLLVGFGVHNYPMFHKSLPFWIVKNSWGPKWGEQGYYRVYRGDGTCGVNQMASSAVVG
ncbi:uncharacterized protein LOC124352819 isoform X2 [Homalodisca vitripennis]|nr:uncharacterized protein LOC124352819 isoform X2 [Homalodisca vitripennis]